MGIRKEIERLEAEEQAKQERIRQERLVIIGKIKERLDFLNEEARALVRPHLQILQESGAIEVLGELKEVAGIEEEVEIRAAVSYLRPFIATDKHGVNRIDHWGEERSDFEGEGLSFTGGFPNFGEYRPYHRVSLESEYYESLLEGNLNPDHLREELRKYSLIDPKKFKVKDCFVSLTCCCKNYVVGDVGETEHISIERDLLFRSLWPNKAVKLQSQRRRECWGDDTTVEEKDLFYFPEKDWPNLIQRELLEKIVAKSYYNLVKESKDS